MNDHLLTTSEDRILDPDQALTRFSYVSILSSLGGIYLLVTKYLIDQEARMYLKAIVFDI